MKTYVAYDKEGQVVNKYYVKDLKDLFNYMVVADYKKTEYVERLDWDKSTMLNEDGSPKPSYEWAFKHDKKIYLHK